MALLVYMYPLEYVYPVVPLLPTSMPLAETVPQIYLDKEWSYELFII